MNAFFALTLFGKLFMALMAAAGIASLVSAIKHSRGGRPKAAVGALISLSGVLLYCYAFVFRAEALWLQLAAVAAILLGLFITIRTHGGAEPTS